MEILTILRTAEFNFAGFLIPWAMIVWTSAYVIALLFSYGIERIGFYRYVWHPPLFFIATVVTFGSILGIIFAP
jgi:hypothetical protein